MPDSPQLAMGQMLGRFRVLEAIGQDSMGRTYLAEDTRFSVRVSLRLFPAALTQGAAVASLGQELLAARSVSHPGLARIFDLHDEGQHTFLTQEPVAGSTLARMLAEAALPAERYLRILTRLAETVAAIHQARLAHGALTPASITVRSGDRPVITDFGLGGARLRLLQGDLHPLDLLLWLAPETAKGKIPSARGDVFALGAILYRCITGKPPYPGRNSAEAYKSLLAGRLVSPRLFNPDVPPELERLVVRALSFDPGRRQPDARELHKELLSVIPEETAATPGRPTSPVLPAAALAAEREDVLDERDAHTQEIPWREKTILMSDIVGITAYFDTHGDMAGRRRIQRHNELLFPLIQAQRGTVVKTIGDAILATFDTADEGVQAAVNMQRALQQHNRALPDAGERLHIRIGLNSGQCIVEAQDVFGDAVNVAARVCSKAGAEQILISAATRAQLRQSKEPMVFFARTSLKGKEEEFDLFLIGWDPDRPLPQERREIVPQEGPMTREMAAAPKASPQEAHIPTVTLPAMSEKIGTPELPFDLPDLSESLKAPARTVRRNISEELQALKLPGEVDPEEPGSQSGNSPAAGSNVKTVYVADPPPATALPETSTPTRPRTRTRMGRAILVLWLMLAGALVWIGVLVVASLQSPQEPAPPPAANRMDSERPAAEPAQHEEPGTAAVDAGLAETEDAGALEAEDAGTSPEAKDAGALVVDKPGRPTPAEARRRLQNAIRRKGLIPGDVPELDLEIQRLPQIEKNSKEKDLLAVYLKAQALVDSVQVGKDFVEKKLLRFNRAFDRLSEAAGSTGRAAVLADIAQVLQDVDRAMNGQNFSEANRQLNRAFEILKKIR